MKVVFVSNFLNHHQLPFCLEMDKLTGGNFTFIATAPISQDRLKLGYHEMDHQYPFVLRAYDSKENEKKALELAHNCDILMQSCAPGKYIEPRIKAGKLSFQYWERPFKQGVPLKKLFHTAASTWLHHSRFFAKPVYLLCASNYAASDFNRFGAYLGKAYKWGYFPEVKPENMETLFDSKRSQPKPVILWVARLIPWKHPETMLRLAQTLKQKGYDFEIHMIGSGPMEKWLLAQIDAGNLQKEVKYLGSMSPEKVREHMENADIFAFTSDYGEGWGAVLNESMNSGCAVVSSHAIGAAGFLLKHGENGLVYRDGDQEQLEGYVMQLLDDPALREKLGRAAYETLRDTWNPQTAAARLLALAEHLQAGKKGSPFTDGPCSKAPYMSNKQAAKRLPGK